MFKRSMIRSHSYTLAFLMAFSPLFTVAQEMNGPKGKAKDASATQKLKNLSDEQKAIHLLDRTTFGPRPRDIDRVLKMGWQKYLDEQLHADRISDDIVEAKLKPLESIHLQTSELAEHYQTPQMVRQVLKSKGMEMPDAGALQNQNPNEQVSAAEIEKRREVRKALAEAGYKPQQLLVQELQQAKILRAVYSERQLQEVMTDFWFNHFNVFIQKGADRILTTAYERDVIRPHVFGKFEDLLQATAESPAMLFYLDNWLSTSPNGPPRKFERKGDLEIRSIGLGRIRIPNPDRSSKEQRPSMPKPDSEQAPEPGRRRGLNENYAREIMELHTLGVEGGYTQKDVQEVARCFTGWTIRNPRLGGEFIFNPRMHDDGEKVVLGQKIAAGGGKKDGETVIKILSRHPSTARFISTKLARKFVSDNPPSSLIDRMAKTFTKTDGDLREVLRTMFNAPEFWAPENYRAKIKTPFEMTVSAVRAMGAETDGSPAFHRWIARMGEGLYLAQPPTGYPDTSEHWVNTGALLERMNFALALTANRIPGTQVNLESAVLKTNEPAELIDRCVKLLLRGEISPQSRALIDKTLSEKITAGADGATNGVKMAMAAGLILGSPEFQRQ